jgi:hypothetical protein
MKYFKDAAGAVYAYDADGSQDHAIPAGQTAITYEQMLVIVNPETPAQAWARVAAAYLVTVRETREAILNRLAGIGVAAILADDTATSQAVATARLALLAITDDAGVVAASNIDALKGAVLAAYKAIAKAAPAELRKAFDVVGA